MIIFLATAAARLVLGAQIGVADFLDATLRRLAGETDLFGETFRLGETDLLKGDLDRLRETDLFGEDFRLRETDLFGEAFRLRETDLFGEAADLLMAERARPK